MSTFGIVLPTTPLPPGVREYTHPKHGITLVIEKSSDPKITQQQNEFMFIWHEDLSETDPSTLILPPAQKADYCHSQSKFLGPFTIETKNNFTKLVPKE